MRNLSLGRRHLVNAYEVETGIGVIVTCWEKRYPKWGGRKQQNRFFHQTARILFTRM